MEIVRSLIMAAKDLKSDSDVPPYCEEFPLHWLVWHNRYRELAKVLASNKYNNEKQDCRGRTPLMLAVSLGHLESTRILLKHTSNVSFENAEGWTVVQEATSTGDPELLSIVLESRDMERFSSRATGIPALLSKLKDAPDFYVEMTWEFTSWVPLVSKICPSDTYKVYKRGSSLRIDTTLVGFDQAMCQRGNRSYIFKEEDDGAMLMEIDHDAQKVYVEKLGQIFDQSNTSGNSKPHPAIISQRLTTPIVTTFLDTDKISFERDKSGIWGWRSDRTENVNGHECKVFSANNVELVTRSRTEHLTEDEKQKNNSFLRNPLESFLTIAETQEPSQPLPDEAMVSSVSISNPTNITPEEYFDSTFQLNGRDIGRPREVITKSKKFKAHLWLAENYPLRLQEQVMPIIDLMAISSSHFAKLKDFIQMQLPSGFPVKIEIPLIHVLTARVTFGNIFGLDKTVAGVQSLEEDERMSCFIDDSIFQVPSNYSSTGSNSSTGPMHLDIDDDDAMLQFAIQQSLHSTGEPAVDIWEALQANSDPSTPQNVSRTSTPSHANIPSSLEEAQLQRVIEESLAMSLMTSIDHKPQEDNAKHDPEGNKELPVDTAPSPTDNNYELAISLSQKQHQEELARRQEEEEMLKQILELSLTEK